MATISSAGVGSGLDVETIVTKLMAIERAPIDSLATQTKTINTKLSSFGQVQSALSTLRDKVRVLTGNDGWSPTTASSADESAVSVTTSTGSAAGSYTVAVSQLATAQTLASGTFAASTGLVGSGTLTLERGAWGAGNASFTPNSTATAVNITVLATDTLASLRDKINTSDSGVVASIVNDTTGARLTLRSRETGAANGFRVTAADSDGNNADAAGLSALAYDPSTGVNSLTRTQSPANALATINGISINSASNTLSSVIDGLSIKLGRVTTTPVDVSVTQDSEAIKKSITEFVTAYNAVVTTVASQTKYDAAAKKGAVLQGDRTAVGLQQHLRSLVGGNSAASTVFGRLSDVGLETQTDGTLSIKSAKLDAAIANVAELKKMFAASDALVIGNNGFATALRTYTDEMLGTEGPLTTRQDGLKQQIKRNDDQSARLETRMTQIEKRMRAQYTALDTQMGKLNGLSSYVSNQIAAWNKAT